MPVCARWLGRSNQGHTAAVSRASLIHWKIEWSVHAGSAHFTRPFWGAAYGRQ